MEEVLEVMRIKKVLTWYDLEKFRTLRHQGRRAMVRYLLGVLPYRGVTAFDALLESLQEANAQHVVDLLLDQNLNYTSDSPILDEHGNQMTPTDTPLPREHPDPHEYAVRLSRNNKLIREFVQPSDVSPVLTQNKVMTPREADMVTHLHGRNKKWDLVMAVLLQRGERAYQAFMAALLQHGYNSIFHTIQETSTELSGSDSDSQQNGQNTRMLRGDGDEDDDVMESDEEIKEEASRTAAAAAASRRGDRDRSLTGSKVDEALLGTSRDLRDVDAEAGGGGGGNDVQSLTETDDRLSADTDLAGYLGYEEDGVSNGRNSAKSHTKPNRIQRRKSNNSLALNSVKEESENPSSR